ncbi:zinc finger protein 423-like [Mercenaria mercenaria]|uniref:zinc finger protein 423-like n=1 Tax=Mercenaria mercenaria TaxID=6596 RepID=UPI00234F5723|nr:zinc finger protein 423-like [Mercenaria mercenaria]
MSRRKQARPRLIKREDDDDEADEQNDEHCPEQKKIKLHDDDVHSGEQLHAKERDAVDTESEIFRCESCGAKFENLVCFMDHKNTQCENGEPVSQKDNGSRSGTPSSHVSRGSSIESADSPLPDLDPEQVPSHVGVDEQHPVPCRYCEKAFAKKSLLEKHEQVHADMLPFNCTVCSRVFKNKKGRDRHEKLHLSEKSHKCDHCGASFLRTEHLKSHMRVHESSESYPCQTCNLEYPTMAALMSHQNAHKPKPIPSSPMPGSSCPDCGDVFFTTTEKDSHVCSEFGAKKTFQCQQCAAICVGPTALALHTEHAHSGPGTEPNKCPLCYKCFLNLDELTAHMKVHESPNPDRKSLVSTNDIQGLEFGASFLSGTNTLCPTDILVCPYCLKDDFDTLEGLELHMQSVHSVKPTEVYTCNYCNAPYKNLYSLHEHMRAIHQNQPSMGIKYPCSRCGKEYPSIESLQDHKKKMHYKPKHSENVISCQCCSLAFASSTSLYEHMRTVHGDRKRSEEMKNPHINIPTPKPSRLSTENKVGDHYQSFSDAHTIINVPEPSQILRHLKTPLRSPVKASTSPTGTVHHGPVLSGRHSQASPSRPPSSGKSDFPQEKIICDQCNAKFSDLTSYQTHMKLHVDSVLGQYSCRQCNKLFLSEEQLESHLSMHYLSASSEYGCTSCNKTFNKPDELQKHLMDIHAHHLYRCSLCKDVFDSKVNIQVHFAIKHSNESKLYRCVVCDIVFRSDTDWQLHLRVTHLNMTKPYRCLFCKESFSSEMDLQCHLATHNKPFKCSMCDETFLVEFLLDKHIQNVHSSISGPEISPKAQAQSPKPISIKVEKDTGTSAKQEQGSNSLLFNPLLPSAGNQSPVLTAGSATLLGEGSQLYQNICGVANSGVINDLSSSMYQGLSPGSSGSGSMVWKSPEDLYRCNICDIKFSQLSGLQNHKLQDHGLKFASGKYSPNSSPKQNSINNGETITSIYNNMISRQSSESSFSSAEKQPSLLQDALTSSFVLPASIASDALIAGNAYTEKLMSSFGEKICMACPFCSQTFKCKADLEKHSKIHLNTGSQKCNICDEVFASSGILAEHKLTHCKIQQGNVCVACKIAIRSEDQFYLHSQEHGFQGAVMQCIVCRQTLASMLELQMHGRHHFQNKSSFHTCCVCLNSFETSENLVSKINSSGRTYYVCKPCYHGNSSEFSCNQCSATFSSKSGLELHEVSHKKSYQCIKCQESFSSEYEIQMHVATHVMTEGNVHECFLCCVVLDSPAKLQCHLIEHTYKNSEYKCSACGRDFNSAVDIQAHAIDHGVTARRYACSQCTQRFFFSAELENHRYLHKMKSEQIAKASSSASKSLTIQPLNIRSLDYLSSGRASSPLESISNKASHSKQTSEDGFHCSKCEQSFSDVFELANHYKEFHTDPEKKTHKCPSCSEWFGTVIQLQAHFFARHASREPEKKPKYACMECGKECSSEHNLLTHMNTHRKGNKVTCPTCSRTFSSSSGLTAHMTAHCGQKHNHECPICHKKFTKKSNKMEHMKIHSGDKIYPCTSCGKLFSGRATLEEHSKIHQEAAFDEDHQTETRSGTSEETVASVENASDEDDASNNISDGEKDCMKQEVTSTSNILEESNDTK